MNNHIGICEWSLPSVGPLSLHFAKEAGFDGIQLGDLGGMGLNYPLNHPRIQQSYLEAQQETGIAIQAVHLHTLVRDGTMLYSPTSAQGQLAVTSIRKGVDACAALGAPVLMLSSFFASLVQNEYEFETFAEHLKLACAYGADHGVCICYESVLPAWRILKMLERVGNGLRICYDLINPIRCGSGIPADEILQLGTNVIDHFHVKDTSEDMKSYCLIGTGRGEIGKSVESIHKIGYCGWFISENYYFRSPIGSCSDPFVQAAADASTMRKLFM